MRTLVIGIKGTVLSLNPETGAEVWRTDLKGIDFVNFALDGERIVATTCGEIFCLDRNTGRILWHNPLKGLGQGLVCIAADSNSGATAAIAEKLHYEEAAAAGAVAGASAIAG